MKADISIIIPIYKGRQYIPYLLDTIRKNAVNLVTLHLACELILVNDFPEEEISESDVQAQGFVIRVLNSKDNRGIHGARVFGLKHAQGEWIVFLDQDDQITDDYLLKQKKCIRDADAVVCNGYVTHFCKDIRNVIYKDIDTQIRVQDLSYYISVGNAIYSPGQVMVKKKAIPNFWRQHILKVNGADDYLLWLLMLKEEKNFTLNEEKLYIHVGHGKNVSNNTLSMTNSVHEVERLLIENDLLDNEEKEVIKNRKIENMSAVRYLDIIDTYDYWMYLENRHQSIVNYFCEKGYFKVGIYGMGSIGNRLCDALAGSDVKTVFAIDQRAKEMICNIPVFCLDDSQTADYVKQVNVIIVTAQWAFGLILEEIENRKYRVEVRSFKDILEEMIGLIR